MERKQGRDSGSSSSHAEDLANPDLTNPSLKVGLAAFEELISAMRNFSPSQILTLKRLCNTLLSTIHALGYPTDELAFYLDHLMSTCQTYVDITNKSPQEVAEAVLGEQMQSIVALANLDQIGMTEIQQAKAKAQQELTSLRAKRRDYEKNLKSIEENDAKIARAKAELQRLTHTHKTESDKLTKLIQEIDGMVETLQQTKVQYNNVDQMSISECISLRDKFLVNEGNRISSLLDSIISQFP